MIDVSKMVKFLSSIATFSCQGTGRAILTFNLEQRGQDILREVVDRMREAGMSK